MQGSCTSQDKTSKYTKEENEEMTNQTWIQGIHRHLLLQTSLQNGKQTLVNCSG